MPLRLRLLPSPGAGGGRGPSEERAIELPDDTREIRIGRRADLELPLPYPALSNLHARLVRAADGWRVEDLGSTNGTRVDGRPLVSGAGRPIAAGAQISLGQVTVVFDGAVAPILGAERTTTLARRLVNDLFADAPGQAAPTLTIVAGVPARPTVRLEELETRYLAGRAETCALQLISDEISREHAAFVRRWDGVTVIDLGSKNGLRVNDEPTRERALHDGDLIQVGPALLRLLDPVDRYLREFEAHGSGRASTLRESDDGGAAGAAHPPAAPPLTETVAARPAVPRPSAPARADSAPLRAGARTAVVVATAVLLIVVAGALALALWR